MTSSGGFVSYRRDDTGPAAGRLADLLVDRFGASRVFMDVDTIDYGQDYVQRIDRAVAGCDVLLALIGRRWLEAVDERGAAGSTVPPTAASHRWTPSGTHLPGGNSFVRFREALLISATSPLCGP